ncbi:MAG: hypothetical protein BGO98_46435 [Myxococcales bacterium 68-20]|nr:MAG: hypothetical protein BGO98_46435 [Myxococcales bacterium 68-20]
MVTSASGELGPNSKVLDEASLGALTAAAEDELVFSTTTGQLEAVAVDDVLLAGMTAHTPGGFLVKVLGTEQRGDAFVVQTRPAKVEEAFKTLSVKAKGRLPVPAAPPSDPSATSTQSVQRIQQGLGFSYPYRLEGSSDNGRLAVQGSLGIDASIGIDLDVNIIEFKVSTVALTFDASESFSADFAASGSSSVDKTLELARIPFQPIPIPVPGLPIPLILNPRIVVEASLTGTTKGELQASVQQDAGFTSSLGYRDGKIGGTFEPNADFNVEQPTYGGSLSLRAAAEARLEVLVYNSFGPYAGIESYLQLSANLEGPPPCVTGVLDAGLAAKVGIRNAFGGDAATRPFDKPFELAKIDTCNGDPNAPRPVPTWSRSYGRQGSTGEEARAVVEASDGTIVVVGTSGLFDGIRGADAGFGVMRLDALGNVLWQRTFRDRAALGGARAVVQNRNGFVVACEYGLAQLDPGGNIVWSRSVFDENARITSIDVREDDTLLVAGEITSDPVAWAMHADGEGNPIWSRRFPGETFARVRATKDGGAVLVGRFKANFGDYYAVKLGADGQVAWQRAIDNRTVNEETNTIEWSIDRAYDVAEKPGGGFFVVGTSLSIYPFPDATGTAYFFPGLIDLAADGSLRGGLAHRAPPGAEHMSAKAVGVRADGSTLIVSSLAEKIDDLDEREDVLLIRGQTFTRLDGGKNDFPYGGSMSSGVPLVMTRDGGALVAVTSNSFSNENRIWLVKLNRAGSIDFPHSKFVDGFTLETQPASSPVTAAPVDAPVKTTVIERERFDSEVTPMTMSTQAP